MKTLATILLSIMTTYGHTSINNEKKLFSKKDETCFSKTNFDSVYKCIEDRIKNGNKIFYEYDNYELYLTESTEISFKKEGYSLAKITKEKGVFSLAKFKKDNDRILKETNQIFCKILTDTEKK